MMTRETGFTMRELSVKLGVSYRSAQRWVHEYSVAGNITPVGHEIHNRVVWCWTACR